MTDDEIITYFEHGLHLLISGAMRDKEPCDTAALLAAIIAAAEATLDAWKENL